MELFRIVVSIRRTEKQSAEMIQLFSAEIAFWFYSHNIFIIIAEAMIAHMAFRTMRG